MSVNWQDKLQSIIHHADVNLRAGAITAEPQKRGVILRHHSPADFGEFTLAEKTSPMSYKAACAKAWEWIDWERARWKSETL